MPPSETVVRSTLGPYEGRIRRCIDRAWADFLTIPVRHRFRFARTRANVVFDLIAGYALAEFDEDQNVRIIQKDETVKLLIGDAILLRIKKANEAGLGSNIPTQSVLEFVCQEPEIPGLLPDVYRIEVCYVEDVSGAEIASVSVTARDNDVKLWSYEIGHAESGSADIMPFPKLPDDDSPPEIAPRKSDDEKKTDDEG
jgi:hypothetical protein